MCQKFGITVPDVERKVCITVLGNVWFYLAEFGFYTDTSGHTHRYVLELQKAMYGLVDAPILWSIALRHFIICDVQGRPSRYDENFFYWPSTDNNGMQSLDAAVTIHVDDLVVTATKQWLSKTYNRFLANLGKVKRCALPRRHGVFQTARRRRIARPGEVR